ncbi:MAG TPA: hypothetical protein PKH02_02020 [Bacteroidales bacterium]|nr:hypothetical protein [Bacteroidales bacterium]
MKTSKFILSLLVALMFASGIGAAFGIGAGAVALGASVFVKAPKGVTLMAVTPEAWTDYIIGNLFKDNEFILASIDESQYVIGAGVVHIPQAGAASGVKRNRTTLPATITRRKDIDVTYVLDEFTTDPRFIPNIDKAELSYDKMDSCMSEDMMYLKQFIAESMLYNWRPTYFIKTTGSATTATVGTGNRNAVKLADFVNAKEVFNKWSIPKTDRYVVMSTDMKSQLTAELLATSSRDFSVIYDPISGDIKKLETFTIYERATALVASNQTVTAVTGKKYFKWTSTDLTYTPEQIVDIEAGNASYATTACEYALFWHKTGVARSVGTTEMFDDQGNPQYYGDIYSFLQRAGGRARRADGIAVLGLIQV